MNDIRLSTGFASHPKTLKLARRCGYEAVVALLQLWSWAAENRCKGVLSNMDADDIEIAAGWNGGPGQFLEACLAIGWLDEADGVHSLHDWEEHQPYIFNADERREKARNAAVARWNRKGECRKQSPRNAGSMQPACAEHAPGIAQSEDEHAPSNAPSHTFPKKYPPIVPPPGGVPASSPAPSKAQVERDARLVLAHLNERKGSAFRKLGNIRARLREGATVDECKAVIDAKMQDPHFRENPQYLNPETLFRASKWERYVEEARHPPASWRKRRSAGAGWSAGAGQWDTAVRLAQQGRYRERMSDHLDPPGVAALMALGGLNAVGAADSFELARLKKAFLERYDVECGAGAQAVGA